MLVEAADDVGAAVIAGAAQVEADALGAVQALPAPPHDRVHAAEVAPDPASARPRGFQHLYLF